tara:strand:- start:215 stop:658 length:444 start_codon:yes stop_codon:yes gene_type:complete
MFRSFWLFISTFFYIGKIKYAPGTIASLATFCIWSFFSPMDFIFRIGLILFLLILSIISIHYSISFFEEEDPQPIVIDEVVGMSIALFFITEKLILMIVAFTLFRLFDILKPSIIFYSQDFKQPYGILMDDILAGIFSGLILFPYTW